ncbi:hypothetical protein SAMN02746095_01869 [Acidocella aminolytica 101 = DSM 11237]|nr:hypothetical protein SAMN02746095_01869 [Acidocella aminolytica 101 = DSM 11237]
MRRPQPSTQFDCFMVSKTLKGQDEWQILDGLPPDIPVSQSEIEVIQRYCRDALETIFRSAPHASDTRSPIPARIDRKAGRK